MNYGAITRFFLLQKVNILITITDHTLPFEND